MSNLTANPTMLANLEVDLKSANAKIMSLTKFEMPSHNARLHCSWPLGTKKLSKYHLKLLCSSIFFLNLLLRLEQLIKNLKKLEKYVSL